MMMILASALLFCACLVSLTEGTAIEKRASKSFAGANSYFLHAISTDYQNQYIEALAADGAKVVRLWGMNSDYDSTDTRLTKC